MDTVIFPTYSNPPTVSQRNIVNSLSEKYAHVLVVPLRSRLNMPSKEEQDATIAAAEETIAAKKAAEEAAVRAAEENEGDEDNEKEKEETEGGTEDAAAAPAPIEVPFAMLTAQLIPITYSTPLANYTHRINMARYCFESIASNVRIVETRTDVSQDDLISALTSVTDVPATLCLGADEYIRLTNTELNAVEEGFKSNQILSAKSLPFQQVLCVSREGFPMPLALTTWMGQEGTNSEADFGVYPHLPTELDFFPATDGPSSTALATTQDAVDLLDTLQTDVLCYMERYQLFALGKYSPAHFKAVNVPQVSRNPSLDTIAGLKNKEAALMPDQLIKPCADVLGEALHLLLQSQVEGEKETVQWIAQYLKDKSKSDKVS